MPQIYYSLLIIILPIFSSCSADVFTTNSSETFVCSWPNLPNNNKEYQSEIKTEFGNNFSAKISGLLKGFTEDIEAGNDISFKFSEFEHVKDSLLFSSKFIDWYNGMYSPVCQAEKRLFYASESEKAEAQKALNAQVKLYIEGLQTVVLDKKESKSDCTEVDYIRRPCHVRKQPEEDAESVKFFNHVGKSVWHPIKIYVCDDATEYDEEIVIEGNLYDEYWYEVKVPVLNTQDRVYVYGGCLSSARPKNRKKTVPKIQAEQVRVKLSKANIRSRPRINSEVIKEAIINDEFELTGKVFNNNDYISLGSKAYDQIGFWYEMNLGNDIIGYVFEECIAKTEKTKLKDEEEDHSTDEKETDVVTEKTKKEDEKGVDPEIIVLPPLETSQRTEFRYSNRIKPYIISEYEEFPKFFESGKVVFNVTLRPRNNPRIKRMDELSTDAPHLWQIAEEALLNFKFDSPTVKFKETIEVIFETDEE